jgi:DNA transposition AAA+ family ATPase
MNMNKKHIRSVSVNDIGIYKTKELNQILNSIQNDLVIYLDYIRNYKEFTPEMLENIKKMDNENKNKIIHEYNKVIGVLKDIFPTHGE